MMTSQKPKSPLLVIVGPTASGKSALALDLAKRFDGEIICADSRTVYREMDIGTAKPSSADQKLVPHHLLDVVAPNETFSAAEFKALAEQAISDIAHRGLLPIIVGGTGLYIDSVLYNYQFPKNRDHKVSQQWQEMTLDNLQALAKDHAIDYLNDSDWSNKRRLIRALELAQTDVLAPTKSQSIRPQTLVIGLTLNKEVIQKRITERITFMLKQGLIEEVRYIGDKYGWEDEAMTGICYRAFRTVAKDPKPTQKMIDDAAAEFAAGDMRLVKKQLTWFRRNSDINWLPADDPAMLKSLAATLVREWL